MKFEIILIALFSAVLMGNQDPVPPQYKIYGQILCIGDSIYMGNKSIKLEKIISDSRCPSGKGITCIWAGEVKILVKFFEEGKFMGEKILTWSNISINNDEIITGSNISIAEFFKTEGLEISSVGVYPYPEGNHKITAEEYSIHLKISEKM